MSQIELQDLLERVRGGHLSVEAALQSLNDRAVADLGYAHVDLHRRERCGFPEVIFCEGKTCEWVLGEVRMLVEAGLDCLDTRVAYEQSQLIFCNLPCCQTERYDC